MRPPEDDTYYQDQSYLVRPPEDDRFNMNEGGNNLIANPDTDSKAIERVERWNRNNFLANCFVNNLF